MPTPKPLLSVVPEPFYPRNPEASALHDPDQLSAFTGVDCSHDEDLAQQQFKLESDINEIMRRVRVTGDPTPLMPLAPVQPLLVDLTEFPASLQEAIDKVDRARESFMSLPATVRAVFEHDPVRMVHWLSDPANAPRARELGLLSPLPAPPAPPSPPLAPTPAPTPPAS